MDDIPCWLWFGLYHGMSKDKTEIDRVARRIMSNIKSDITLKHRVDIEKLLYVNKNDDCNMYSRNHEKT